MRYRRVRIHALGYELPPVVVSTEEIEERLAPVLRVLGVGPGQLAALTGIVERRYWQAGTTLADGAVAAAQNALEQGSVPADAIEALVYGGVCRENFEPATACQVAAGLERLGLGVSPAAFLYDLSNACLGVGNGLLEIANRIELGQIRAGMVVSCEGAREIVDATVERLLEQPSRELLARSLATFTGGSGAAAVVLTDDSYGSRGHPLLGGVNRSAPRFHELCRWGVERVGRSSANGDAGLYRHFMATEAAELLEHGVELARQTWPRFLDELGWSVGSVDRTVCHQVGPRHREAVLAALGVPAERDFASFEYLGNTGSVALPLALALAVEQGFVEQRQRIGLLGIGSGLSCLMLGLEW